MARVWSEVFSPQIISKSGIRSAGLKKWRPIIRPGSFRTEAISVMGRAEVFVPKIVSGLQISSSFFQISCLTSISSNTASITRSTSFRPSSEVVVMSRSRISPSRSSSVIFFCLIG